MQGSQIDPRTRSAPSLLRNPSLNSSLSSGSGVSAKLSVDEILSSGKHRPVYQRVNCQSVTDRPRPPTAIARADPVPVLSASEAVTRLLESYRTCLEGDSTPWDAMQCVVPVLNHLESERSLVLEGMGDVCKSSGCVKSEVMHRGEGGEEGRLLRLLRIQILIRIVVWNINGEGGWTVMESMFDEVGEARKTKRQRKTGKQSKTVKTLPPGKRFVANVISLIELAPYVLPPSLEFSQWLKETLTFGFQQSIPEYGRDILDHFEIEIVENAIHEVEHMHQKRHAQHCKIPSAPSTESVTTQNHRQTAYFSSLANKCQNADGESATIGSDASVARSQSTGTGSLRSIVASDREADATLFQKSLSLTASDPKRRTNPFLKDTARGYYVGSHLSSKLSNITSLFREVKAPPKIKADQVNCSIEKESLRSAAEFPAVETASAVAPFAMKRGRKPLDSLILTPKKRPKPSSIPIPSSGSNYVVATPLRIISETPTKTPSRRGDAHLDGTFNRHSLHLTPQRFAPQKNRRFLPIGRENEDAEGGLFFGLSPMPQQRGKSGSLSKVRDKKWK